MDNITNKLSMHVDMDNFIPATADEKAYMVQMRESSTFFKDGVKRLVKNKVALVSLIIIVVITLAALIIPAFWPYGYDQQIRCSHISSEQMNVEETISYVWYMEREFH